MNMSVSSKISYTNLALFIFSTLFFSCKNEVSNKEISVQNEVKSNELATNSFDFLPSSTTNSIVKHENYSLSYVEKYEQAEWVAYEFKKSNLENHHYKRPFFIEDDLIESKSADWRNYKKSGYDKGHLCPAADMQFSESAFNATFLTSNISPQKHDFNAGIWNLLEQKVRYWAEKYNGIFVVTGPVLTGNLKTIGAEKVSIPDYFYKILLKKNGNDFEMIAFLVPAENSDKPIYNFVVSVDKIELLTGIDFFPKMEDKLEFELEKNSDYKSWSFD